MSNNYVLQVIVWWEIWIARTQQRGNRTRSPRTHCGPSARSRMLVRALVSALGYRLSPNASFRVRNYALRHS